MLLAAKSSLRNSFNRFHRSGRFLAHLTASIPYISATSSSSSFSASTLLTSGLPIRLGAAATELSQPPNRSFATIRLKNLDPSKFQPTKMSEENKDTKGASATTKKEKKVSQTAQFTEAAKFVNPTPKGQKKDFSLPMEDAYDPMRVEASWDAFWEAHELYQPDDSKPEKFTIVIPPPNVTGSLHLGHALTIAIQDSIVRWNRMNGKCTLYVPGTDHAGIATQVVVEKQLARTKGISRHTLGREEFIKEVWAWKEKNGDRIQEQIRSMGTSVDWSRLRFTMDDRCGAAVKEAFIRMYSDKKIYRANRIVTWSCTLRSAISSIEVDYLDVEKSTMVKVPGHNKPVEIGVLHSFAYPVKDSTTNEELVVSTTRIETMLGDVAVAVHPEDKRYQHLIGKELVHPFHPDRKVIVIADGELVDPAFGTGAVKITPAHDPNDFLCGNRHNLPRINLLNDDGTLNHHAGKYQGMHRFAARELVIEDLKALGLYRKKEDNKMAVGLCSRSKDIVEPIIRPQWWVDCKEMAAKSVEAVEKKELNILPSSHETTWYRWLENIQDWCISRQLWWGHRIPAYYARREGEAFPTAEEDLNRWIIAPSVEDAQKVLAERFPDEAKSFTLEQDHDVLDTWFSSGLFPFSVMGWPENTDDVNKYFPNSLLETGQDILFFWVARMVMMSLHLTGKLPFSTVYLHTMVRDRIGRKMSKSLGNVIDPLDVINGISLADLQRALTTGNLDPEEVKLAQENQSKDFPLGIPTCGADALRFGLLGYTRQGSDINLDPNRLIVARNFCNKLWQATRFALMNFPADFAAPASLDAMQKVIAAAGGPSTAQAWILSRLHAAIAASEHAFTQYEFGSATAAVQTFFVDELCARYLELIKAIVKVDAATATQQEKASAESHLAVLFICLDYALRLLHPMMPFVTEELWHRLPGYAERAKAVADAAGSNDKRAQSGSIMVAPFPRPSWTVSLASPQAEQEMAVVDQIVLTLRSAKNSVNIPKARPQIFAVCADASGVTLVKREAANISTLALTGPVTAVLKQDVEEGKAQINDGCITAVASADFTLCMVIEGLIDTGVEVVKTERKLKDLKQANAALLAVVQGPNYAAVVKPEIQAKNDAKLKENAAEIESLEKALVSFSKITTRKQYATAKSADLQKELEKLDATEARVRAGIKPPKNPEEPQIPKKTQDQLNVIEQQRGEMKAELEALQTELSKL